MFVTLLSLLLAGAALAEKELVAKNEGMERRLEARYKEMETRIEAKEKEMETMLQKLDKMKKEMEGSASKLRMEIEENLRKEIASNFPDSNALMKPSSLRNLPIVLISAWRDSVIISPQTVTFESFLTNFDNGERPGGRFDLDSGVFTCLQSGYYTVSFSAYGALSPAHLSQDLFLFKNGLELPESALYIRHDGEWTMDASIGVTSTRSLVSNFLEIVK